MPPLQHHLSLTGRVHANPAMLVVLRARVLWQKLHSIREFIIVPVITDYAMAGPCALALACSLTP